MKYARFFPVICLVSAAIFVFSLAGIALLLHGGPPGSGALHNVPYALLVGVLIMAPAFIVFAASAIGIFLWRSQQRQEKVLKSEGLADGQPKNVP